MSESTEPTMPDLPAVKSTWIHRDSLTAVTVSEIQSVDDDRYLVEYWQTTEHRIKAFWGMLPLADFHRDFIPDGPVTLEAFQKLEWDCSERTRVAVLDVYKGHGGKLMSLWWNEHKPEILDAVYFEDGKNGRFGITLAKVQSIRDVLTAMRVFGKEPQP